MKRGSRAFKRTIDASIVRRFLALVHTGGGQSLAAKPVRLTVCPPLQARSVEAVAARKLADVPPCSAPVLEVAPVRAPLIDLSTAASSMEQMAERWRQGASA